MCYQLMQELRNMRISIQGQPFNRQKGLGLKQDRSWASYRISLALALQPPSEGSGDHLRLVGGGDKL